MLLTHLLTYSPDVPARAARPTTLTPLLGFGLTQIGMLWWLAAAAAPLVIHLLSRRRYREVPWAAVEYLLAALQKSSRRLRIEQLLLLVIRTLIIVCVVIAVAGPYLEQLGGALGLGQPVHRILVIDGSYSMGYKPGEKSRFELAKRYARDIIAQSRQGDGFSLVLMSDPARIVVGAPAFISDDARAALQRLAAASSSDDLSAAERQAEEDDFVKQIHNLKLPHGRGNLPETLDRVNELIARTRQENPRLSATEVYFLTDLGRTSWDLNAAAGGRHIHEQLSALEDQARLAVVDLGQDRCENLAVTGLRATQPVFTAKGASEFQAQVHNFGHQRHHAQLNLLVDGQRFQQRPVDLEPGADQTIAFAHRFEGPGDHAVEVRLEGDPLDALDIDDHRWLSAPVKESLEALVVNGEGSHEQGRYLFNALNPYRDGSETLPVHVVESSDGRLAEQDLHHFDCLFFSNVARFTTGEARLLADYARQGGGLVFFLGDRVDGENYNQELGGGRANSPRLLPGHLDAPAAAGTYTFDPLGYKDPIIHEFQGNVRAGLLSTTINRYFKLKAWDVDAKSKQPAAAGRTALAVSETGDPAILTAPLARVMNNGGTLAKGDNAGGWSILVALPASFAAADPANSQPWSNWPLKYSFQPVVQNLLLAAIGPQGGDRNTLVGRPLESSLASAASSGSLSLESPDGHKQQIRVASRDDVSRWTYSDTWLSGIYKAEFPVSGGGESQQAKLFAVNVDTIESDLTKIPPSELPDGVTVVEGTGSMSSSPTAELASRTGQQRPFLFAALGLLFAETFLAWWFGYRAS